MGMGWQLGKGPRKENVRRHSLAERDFLKVSKLEPW
jgi:hypothetical protein